MYLSWIIGFFIAQSFSVFSSYSRNSRGDFLHSFQFPLFMHCGREERISDNFVFSLFS